MLFTAFIYSLYIEIQDSYIDTQELRTSCISEKNENFNGVPKSFFSFSRFTIAGVFFPLSKEATMEESYILVHQ